jgi:hypothetical protein
MVADGKLGVALGELRGVGRDIKTCGEERVDAAFAQRGETGPPRAEQIGGRVRTPSWSS